MKDNKYIPISEPDLSGNENKYLEDCLKSGWISSKGIYVTKFEEQFARFIGTKYAVSTSNGTSALHLVLHGFGIHSPDEVIIPDFTFVATANTVMYTGAHPVFVDITKDTCNVDAIDIEKKISQKTKAIIAVHLFGYPAEMTKIQYIAKKHNLILIEDAAEAHGAEIKIGNKWSKVGSIGNAGIFSFYGNKIITTGEGGMVVTNNRNLYEKLRILRDHGQDPKKRYFFREIGFNYRMTNLQAAIGLAQLERIEIFINKKRMVAEMYVDTLKNVRGITFFKVTSDTRPVYWMNCISVEKPYRLTRNGLMRVLSNNQIETRPFFYPLHTLPMYKMKNNYPNTTKLASCGICLPSSTLLSEYDIKRIADIIRTS